MLAGYTYPKPLRLPIGNRLDGKKYLSEKAVRRLFDGRVIVEEKMDGKQTFFEVSGRYILWVEDLKRKHSIKYRIPGRYALFDVYDLKAGYFLDYDMKLEFWYDLSKGRINVPGKPLIFPVPLIVRSANLNLECIPQQVRLSAYAIDPKTNESTFMEGVVVKQDRPLYPTEVEHGKFVRKEFTEGIKTTYMSLPAEFNIIDPSVPIVVNY